MQVTAPFGDLVMEVGNTVDDGHGVRFRLEGISG
jgi:hypothetical protein